LTSVDNIAGREGYSILSSISSKEIPTNTHREAVLSGPL
jgi:hypothetical protein